MSLHHMLVKPAYLARRFVPCVLEPGCYVAPFPSNAPIHLLKVADAF